MSSQHYPGWAYMLAGLLLGLFIAFIVYLQNLPEVDDKQPIETPIVNTDTPDPTFDFYKILPGVEVFVPDLSVPASNDDKKIKPKPPTPSPELAQGEQFILQAGSFKDFAEADKLKATLALIGVEARIQKVTVDSDTWHRVRIGPYNNRQKLNITRQQLQQNDIQAITLKISG